MLKVPNEFKVGVVATIAIVLLVLGYNMLRGKNAFNRERIYFARYQHVEGLTIAAHVRYKGMNVGRVQDMELAKDGTSDIIVSMNVNPDLEIPKGSVAKIVQIDLFGTKAVQINLSDVAEMSESGDTLRSELDEDIITAVQKQASSLLTSLDSVVHSVRQTFDEETRHNLQKSFASIQNTLDNFDKSVSSNQKRIDRILANIESITNHFNENKDQITAILSNVNAVADSLRRANITGTITEARDALGEATALMQKINEGQGSMGMLVNDEKLYRNLETSAKSLDELLTDFRANPGKYVQFSVFGKKDKSGEPPK